MRCAVCGQFASPHHAPVALFCHVVAVAVARPLVSSHLPEPQCWRRIRWRSCRRCPKLVQVCRREPRGIGGIDARQAQPRRGFRGRQTRHDRLRHCQLTFGLDAVVRRNITGTSRHVEKWTARRLRRRQSHIHAGCEDMSLMSAWLSLATQPTAPRAHLTGASLGFLDQRRRHAEIACPGGE